ncbi:MAG: glycoside hydrolase family 2 protein [Planctomycetota bacterium]
MQRIDLNGPWKVREARAEDTSAVDLTADEWVPAHVPGGIYTDLMAAGRIPDPFYRLNADQERWIPETDWLYARTFEVDGATLGCDRATLVFEGLDTFGRVMLNGREIGRPENGFVEHEFDVTDALVEGENVLAVRIDSATRICREREAEYGELPGHARVYARKPQYAFGWDWGPSLPTCGIWRDVSIRAVDHGRIRSVHAPATVREGRGHVDLSVELERTDAVPLTVNVTLSRGTEIVEEVELHDVGEEVTATLEVARPLLWWPAGMGDPDLYDVCVRLRDRGEELDRREFRIGFRTVEIEQEPDDAGESFIFKVNGRRVFCRGVNWIPPDSFLPRITARKYRELLQAAFEENANLVRVWGGGIYEADVFYEVCDELGLMVWQDFMFACGEYPDLDWFHQEVEREAESVVRRLRNHPSLAVWCGNNENHMGHDNWGWPETFHGRRIYHEILPAVCDRLDPDRPYHPGCPYGGENSNCETHGDMHNWKVWHGGRDYRKYLECRARFVSEFGFQSFPTLDTVLEFAEPEDLSLQSEVMRAHQKCRGGNDRLLEAIGMFYPEPANFDDLILFTQMIHGQAMQTAIEHWRRLKWHTAGTIIWQLDDCWPAISWALVDGSLRRKPAHYFVRRAYAPVLVTAHVDGDEVAVWGINDTRKKVSGTADIERYNMRGEANLIQSGTTEIPADGAVELCRFPRSDLGELDEARHFLWVTFYSDIHQCQAVLTFAEVRDLVLPEPEISVETEEDAFDGQRTVRLTATAFTKGVWLTVPGSDVRFSDNAFDLVPYVPKEVRVIPGEGPRVGDLEGALRIQHCNRRRPGT